MLVKQMPIPTENICGVERLFPNAEELMKVEPYGYAINRGGVGLDTKSPFWAIADDPLAEYNGNTCVMCLVKFLDGSPIAIRYHKKDIVRAAD